MERERGREGGRARKEKRDMDLEREGRIEKVGERERKG